MRFTEFQRDRFSGRDRDRHEHIDEIARGAMERFERRQQEVIDRAIGEHFRKWTADDDSPDSERFSSFIAKASRVEVERVVAEEIHKFAEGERRKHTASGGGLAWKEGTATGTGNRIDRQDVAEVHFPTTPEDWRKVAAVGIRRRLRPFDIERAITLEGTNITGAPTDAVETFAEWSAANEFAGIVRQRVTAGDSFKRPKLGAITFSAEDTVNPSGRTETGTLTDQGTVNLRTFVAQASATYAQLNDVPGLRAEIGDEVMRQAGSLAGSLIYAVIKASTTGTGGIHEILSGASAAPPAATAVYGKLLDMLEQVESQYRANAMWIVSRALERKILEAQSTSDYVIDPVDGLRRLSGYVAVVGDHFTSGTADDTLGAFGDFNRALILGTGNPMIIAAEFEQTKPGAITFFSNVRYGAATMDTKALVAMSANDS